MRHTGIPQVRDLYSPIVDALKSLGGEGPRSTVKRRVAEMFSLTPEQMDMRVENPRYREKKLFDHRLDSAKVRLKKKGVITSPRRGYWKLSQLGQNAAHNVDTVLPVRTTATSDSDKSSIDSVITNQPTARAIPGNDRGHPKFAQKIPSYQGDRGPVDIDDFISNYQSWRAQLLDHLHQMSAMQLERFFALIFSSEGVDRVETVNALGVGAIEGTMVSDGFLSFRVAFKFVGGNRMISAQEVDDFRRSLRASRADKGLLITTGSFTQESLRDAGRGQSPAVELIDGELFLNKLKERSLGIDTEQVLVERVVVNRDFFANI